MTMLESCCTSDTRLMAIEDACRIVADHARPIEATETVDLTALPGRTLAEQKAAVIPLPRFNQSAVDGFALAHASKSDVGDSFRISARIAAGAHANAVLSHGEAARIFTGAPMPAGSDRVVMQEEVEVHGDTVRLMRAAAKGENIRFAGEDIKLGEALVGKGTRCDARHVALLASQGLTRAKVVRRPRVAFLSTGNEIVETGTSLTCAAVFDSNRPMLMAMAARQGLETLYSGHVDDNPRALEETIAGLADMADLVITTGGAGPGEEDHLYAVLARRASRLQRLGVAVKPGKPSVVATVRGATVLALPGNPVAAMVTWMLLAGTAIAKMEGRRTERAKGCATIAVNRYRHMSGRTEFAPCRVAVGGAFDGVEIVGRGGSARLKPLGQADGLVEIASGHSNVEPGDAVRFHPFDI